MRYLNFKQILILLLIFFFFFGDFFNLRKNIKNLFNYLNTFIEKKNKKKGI